MDKPVTTKLLRCAIYTRKSTEHNLDLEFNSLQAQREACEAYIKSQAHEGWRLLHHRFDDGAFSGASLERPALQELLTEVRTGKIDVIVVYKVDRLTRTRCPILPNSSNCLTSTQPRSSLSRNRSTRRPAWVGSH
jgi:site-specific DNA recombinase